MVNEKQTSPVDESSSTGMVDTERAEEDKAPPDLDAIQAASETQALPEQDKVFQVARRVRSRLHNLPDPARPPLGFVPGRGFDVVFPFIKLPHLAPNLNGDWVQFGSPDLEPNRLYYGDNLQVLRTLPSKSIDLIYIDPPFFSGAEYNVIWGDTNEVRTFSDIWEGGLDTYLIWLNARLWEMRRVLKDTGSFFVHCDWHASHYIKGELDKIFGYGQSASGQPTAGFRNEIVWAYRGGGVPRDGLAKKHDVILWYSKGPKWKFRVDRIRIPYSGDSMERLRYTARAFRDSGTYEAYRPNELGKHPEDWWQLQPLMPSEKVERIGYPTQKPIELLDRIVDGWSDPGDVVADFFVGGGSFLAAAFGVRAKRTKDNRPALDVHGAPARRWIGCDSSRVAVSVTLNRLVKFGEEQSGVLSNYGKAGQVQPRMDLPTPEDAVPDIRVNYVGIYPVDRFEAVDQEQFESFILACLAAQADSSSSAISGWRSAREPLRIGPADPDQAPDPKDMQAFFEAVLKQLQPNVRTVARYVCWRGSPELTAYRRKLSDYVRRNVQPRGADMEFDFLYIDSEEFRDRIRQKYPDADDNEFLLRFTKEPVIGEIAATRRGQRKYRFEARDADSTNAGGYLVNCQWDFDYQRGHFAADSKYVLGRRELKGKEAKAAGHKFEGVLTAEHTFPSKGSRTVACRVQDNLGAETIRTISIEVS